MNKNLQDPTAHTSARRRLVRGVFAAPAALSLYSGGAFAANSISCVVREISENSFPDADMDNVTFVRVQLWNLSNGGSDGSAWVKGLDLAIFQAASATLPPYLNTSQWQCFSTTGTSSYAAGDTISTTPTEPGHMLTHDGMWVALKIDDVGNIKGIVGIGPNTIPGPSAVHQSCWTSFKNI